MKKLTIILCCVAMMFCVIPKVDAADQKYGITVAESDWTAKTGGGYYINQVYSITKTNGAGYVYLTLLENLNVKITQVVASDAFEIVGDYVAVENGRVYVLKTKSGAAINGTKTELMTVVADIVDPKNKSCDLSYAPLDTNCSNINGKYFDNNGKLVTEDEYKKACEGTTPTNPENPGDDPNDPSGPNNSNNPKNPQTGSVIPYIAIGGGLAAIAGVYFVSRKSNKMYKI